MPRPSPITPVQVQDLIALYQAGTSRNQLAIMFNASRPFVTDCLQRHAVRVRGIKEACPGFPLKHNAFAFPETDAEAAYWIGFLMADGCVSQNSGRGPYHVIIVLSVVDIEHIRSFQKFVGSTHAIQIVPPKRNRLVNSGECSRLDLVSQQMADDLIRHGVTPKKTHTAKVSEALAFNRDFWRGVIDGDGNIRIDSSKIGYKPKPIIQLTGSLSLTTQFAAMAARTSGATAHPCKSRGSYNISISCSRAIALIYHLYSDCSVALPRKLAKAREILANT